MQYRYRIAKKISRMSQLTSYIFEFIYHRAQMFDVWKKRWQMKHTWNFDEQNFDPLVVGFIGVTLTEKISRENSDELAICQMSNFSTIKPFHCAVRPFKMYCWLNSIQINCDCLSENPPSSHLPVFREIDYHFKNSIQ